MERELKEQLEKITSQLHNVETKLGDVSKQLDKSEITSAQRKTQTDVYMSAALSAAAVGLAIAGVTAWYVVILLILGLCLMLSSVITRVGMRRKRMRLEHQI